MLDAVTVLSLLAVPDMTTFSPMTSPDRLPSTVLVMDVDAETNTILVLPSPVWTLMLLSSAAMMVPLTVFPPSLPAPPGMFGGWEPSPGIPGILPVPGP